MQYTHAPKKCIINFDWAIPITNRKYIWMLSMSGSWWVLHVGSPSSCLGRARERNSSVKQGHTHSNVGECSGVGFVYAKLETLIFSNPGPPTYLLLPIIKDGVLGPYWSSQLFKHFKRVTNLNPKPQNAVIYTKWIVLEKCNCIQNPTPTTSTIGQTTQLFGFSIKNFYYK